MPEATDPRRQQAKTERNLLIGAIVLLVLVGGGLIVAIYGGGAAFLGLPCLLAGALVIVLLWLLVKLFERLGGE
jgi:fatty acid desaturase